MPQQPTQQGNQEQQQQARVDEEYPHPNRGHGHEVDLDNLPPPARACLPGQHDGVSVEG